MNCWVLMLSFCISTNGQAENKDSLLNIAQNHKVDTTRISAYVKLALLSKKDSALLRSYANLALQLSNQNNFKTGKIKSLSALALHEQLFGESKNAKQQYQSAISLARKWNKINDAGFAYRNISAILKGDREYDLALLYADTALKIFRATGDSAQLETLYGNIGRIYLEQNKFNEAITYFIIGMKAYERSKNYFGIAKTHNDIGSVYERMGDGKKALESFLKMIEPARKAESDEQLAIAYQNVGSVYYGMGKDSLAIIYIRQAYDFNKKANRKKALLISIFNLACVKNRLLQYKEAIQSYEECISLAKELDDDYLLAISYQNAAVVYSAMHQNTKAKQYFDKALEMEVALNDAQFTMKLFDDVAIFYRSIDNYKKAYDYKIIADKFKDSLTSVEKELQIAEIETQYETEKKERKISAQELIIQQQKNKQRAIIFSVSALVLLIAGGTLFYLQKNKAKLEKQHFISILDAEQKERMRIARDLHDSIGQMLSAVKMQLSSLKRTDEPEQKTVEQTQTLLDNTIQEVRHISHNLIPEELNFGIVNALEEMCNRINTNVTRITVNIDEKLKAHPFNKQFELSLYRIVQEILSNMLKHAAANEIVIRMEQKNNFVLLDIRDDGKGFDTTEIKDSTGLGWKNIFARVSLLNGKMDIHSEKINGTQIQIILPQ